MGKDVTPRMRGVCIQMANGWEILTGAATGEILLREASQPGGRLQDLHRNIFVGMMKRDLITQRAQYDRITKWELTEYGYRIANQENWPDATSTDGMDSFDAFCDDVLDSLIDEGEVFSRLRGDSVSITVEGGIEA